MSDPVTNVDVEDVLSSIRRLVSDDPSRRAGPAKPAPAREPARDTLVLTPAQRVEPTEAPDEAAAEPLSGAMAPADLPQTVPATPASAAPEAVAESDATLPEGLVAPEAPETDVAPDDMAVLPADVAPDSAPEAAQDARESRLLEIEALARQLLAQDDPVAQATVLGRMRAALQGAGEPATVPAGPEAPSAEPDAPAAQGFGEAVARAVQSVIAEEIPPAQADPDEEDDSVPSLFAEDEPAPLSVSDDPDQPAPTQRDVLRLEQEDAIPVEATQVALPEDFPAEDPVTSPGRAALTLEEKIAELEALIGRSTAEFEPDTEDRGGNAAAVLGTLDAMPWDDAPAADAQAQGPDAPEDGGISDLDEAQTFVFAHRGTPQPSGTPDEAADAPEVLGDAAEAQDDGDTGQDPVTLAVEEADFAEVTPEAEPEAPQPRWQRDPDAPRARPGHLHVAYSAEDEDTTTLDEDQLRDLVGRLIRAELQGVLGERITRNVRKLVRREIQRALMNRDLE